MRTKQSDAKKAVIIVTTALALIIVYMLMNILIVIVVPLVAMETLMPSCVMIMRGNIIVDIAEESW